MKGFPGTYSHSVIASENSIYTAVIMRKHLIHCQPSALFGPISMLETRNIDIRIILHRGHESFMPLGSR